MQKRNILLGVVIFCVIVLVFLSRRSEGLTGTCRKSLAAYKNGQFGTDASNPPLSATDCKNEIVKRKGKCYKSNGSSWVKNSTPIASCKSWVDIVDWRSKDVRDKAGGSPFQRPKNYKKFMNKRFNGGAFVGGGAKNVDNAKACAVECGKATGCAGFVLNRKGNNGKYECWMVDAARVSSGYKDDPAWNSYAKSNVTVGNAGASGSNSGGAVAVAGNGSFYMRVKDKGDKTVYGSKDVYGYVKHDSIESQGGCNNADDHAQIRYKEDELGKSISELGDTSYYKWSLAKGTTGYKITNYAQRGAGCQGYYLTAAEDTTNTCNTASRNTQFNSWGEWVFEKNQGGSYKMRLSNCKADAAGAYFYVGKDGSNLTTKANGTDIYLESA